MALTPEYLTRVDEAVERLIDEGDSPLWTSFAARFPEANDGSEPAGIPELREAFRVCAASWVLHNVPGADPDESPETAPSSFMLGSLIVKTPDAAGLVRVGIGVDDEDEASPLGQMPAGLAPRLAEIAELTHGASLTLFRDWEGMIHGILDGDARFDVLAFTETGRVGSGGVNLPVYFDTFAELIADRAEWTQRHREHPRDEETYEAKAAKLLARYGARVENTGGGVMACRVDVPIVGPTAYVLVTEGDVEGKYALGIYRDAEDEGTVEEVEIGKLHDLFRHVASDGAVAAPGSRTTPEIDDDSALSTAQSNAIGRCVAAVLAEGNLVTSVSAFIPGFDECCAQDVPGDGRLGVIAFVDVAHREHADAGSTREDATRFALDRDGFEIAKGDPKSPKASLAKQIS